MPSTSDTTPAETRARLRNFDDKMRSIPGVQAVSVTLGSRPMIHDSALPFWIEGEPKPAHDSDMHAATFFLVESGFREAMGITLLRGRFVTDQDNENTPIVIDIDDNFARRISRARIRSGSTSTSPSSTCKLKSLASSDT